jgi:hypothetical protein
MIAHQKAMVPTPIPPNLWQNCHCTFVVKLYVVIDIVTVTGAGRSEFRILAEIRYFSLARTSNQPPVKGAKVNFIPEQAMNTQKGSRGTALLFL